MRKTALLLSSIILFCSMAASQTPTPTPTPTPLADSDVVKITTTLIQVDATVTGKDGRIVTDLRPEEFEIYENGEKQKITNFSFISNVRTPPETNTRPNTILPPPPVRMENVRRTIALVVDDLTLSFESTYRVRLALKKFVDEQMQDGDLVAIIRAGAGIGALQQFTNDKRQLYAAIERVRWNAVGSGGIGTFVPMEPRIGSLDPRVEYIPTDPEAGSRGTDAVQAEFEDFRANVFAVGTLGAVNYVVRGMEDLPGRKSILLLSDGFKLFNRDTDGTRDFGRVFRAIRTLIDRANRASVVIYTMDGRGLSFSGLTAGDSVAGWTQQQIDEEMADRRVTVIDTQASLQFLAQQTGGLSIVNNNDLSGGIRKILDDQSYYLVGYEPDPATFDPRTSRFNKLEIKVTRPNTKVRYRSGFFGISDTPLLKLSPAQTNEQRLLTALTSPFAVNEISLKLNALYYGPGRSGTSIVRSLMHIRTQDLKFSDEPDGSKKATFDIVAIAFGDNGTVVQQAEKTYALSLKKSAFERVLKTGIVYDFAFPMKKAGAYQFRVALRDHGGDRIGSANQFVEVPDLKKKRLVLSGVVLEDVPYDEWKRRSEGGPRKEDASDPLSDTSLREFKRGTVLNYGFTIYNAPAAGTLTYQTRVFRDGKLLYETSVKPVDGTATSDGLRFNAALALGAQMAPGDYVLQVVVGDGSSKNTAAQFVTFELIE